MSSYECGVCGWAGRMPWGRECPQCHPKTDQQITFQVLAGRRDEEAIAAAKRYVRGLEAQVQRVRAVADAWEYYASENGNVRTAWAASSVREALDGDSDE